jgi:L-asparaginase II
MATPIPIGDYIVTDRAGIAENRYAVHAAVVDATGKLLYAVGNPSRMTLARSAAKPAQALAVLETGGPDQFGFDDADLALMCASHSSENRHIIRAQAMLAKVGAKEGHLACGGHPAVSEAVNRAWIKSDFSPTAVCNNCSGKHAGMLAGAKAIGAELADYHLPKHPMQLQVNQVFGELSNLDANGAKWGIDGCNLPSPAAPLHVLARVYSGFAAAADTVQTGTTVAARTRASSRIFQAMAKHPELVGGDGRFCTELMRALQGTLIGKIGADACYCVGIRASEQSRELGADGAVGIAVKIEDGDINMLYSAVIQILEELQLGPPVMHPELSGFHRQKIFNTVGIVTGHVSHQFNIRSVGMRE